MKGGERRCRGKKRRGGYNERLAIPKSRTLKFVVQELVVLAVDIKSWDRHMLIIRTSGKKVSFTTKTWALLVQATLFLTGFLNKPSNYLSSYLSRTWT